ncbi:hypothetical protein Pint_35255 [Pistacia integerrima]|uniref:Uncharacterized protein n=1 Tax=Pistacia integerrima TaxID=434235 RepID=A0ACC0Y2P4_9ROSI|nr:hypothetical protein Pint_35255 [Pistacia integerrima]
MRFFGKIGDSMVTILVDSGSTHNFLNSKLATKMGIYPTKKGEFLVQVADGNKMKSEGLCERLPILVQKVQFHVDFYLLPVEGCDAIFGTQWVKNLGPIIWEFNELWMRFWWEGKTIELRGTRGPINKIIGDRDLEELLRKGKKAFLLQFNSLKRGLEIKRKSLPLYPNYQRHSTHFLKPFWNLAKKEEKLKLLVIDKIFLLLRPHGRIL